MSKFLSLLSILAIVLSVFSPVKAYAADGAVGNEVLDTADTTLTRTGAGTAGSPFKLQLNLGNANTWTAAHTFNGTVTLNGALNSNGTLNLGDGGDAATISGTTVGVNIGDNTSDSFDLQQAANNYVTINTTDSSESVSFGNATTNPVFNFLGNGLTTFNGGVTVTNGRTFTANGILSLGDGGDSATISATTLTLSANGAGNDMTLNLVDNNNDAFDLQQGANNYLNITTVDGAETVSFGNSSTNPLYFFSGNGSTTFGGNVTVSGDIGVNGGDITTTALTGNLFNTTATTVNVGGSATTVSFGASTGTATIRNTTVSLPNATSLNATAATADINTLNVGGGYGSSGTTVSSSGNTSTNGNLTVDGSTTLTGSLSAGAATFTPASTSDVTINTDADSMFVLTGLTTGTGTQLCIDGSNNVVTCTSSGGGTDLQGAYDAGNTIVTTDARNIAFSLSDTLTDSNFSVTTASGSTGHTVFSRADGSGANDPSQIVLIDNLENDRTQPAGLKIQSAAGGLTTALDVSDAEITTALSAGSNDLSGTNWSITGSSGNFTTSADIAVNGGDIVTTASTGNLFNTTVTTLNIGGAATTVNVGASTGTTTVNNGLTVTGNLTGGSASFSPASTSDVTVNTDADSTLVVTGLATATGDGLCIDASNNVIICSGTPSDRRLKQNITPLSDMLLKVLKVQGVRYDKLTDTNIIPDQGRRIGFIAQELEQQFPELVYTDHNGIKSVDYEKMTAILVETTKEQQVQIDELKKELELIKAKLQ